MSPARWPSSSQHPESSCHCLLSDFQGVQIYLQETSCAERVALEDKALNQSVGRYWLCLVWEALGWSEYRLKGDMLALGPWLTQRGAREEPVI